MANSPIVRDVLDNGLRLLTEPMTQVRSISIGVWLTRGSRHESDGRERHRALRRAHALQGHHEPIRRRTSRRPSTRSAASSTRSPPRNTPATTSRCSTSICRSRSISCATSSCTPRSRRTTSSARRRASSSKKSRWSRTRRTTSSTSCSRSSSGRDHPLGRPILGTRETVESFIADRAARVLRAHLCAAATSSWSAAGHLEHAQVREMVAHAFGSLPIDPATARRRSAPSVVAERRDRATRTSSRATSASARAAYPQDHDDRHVALRAQHDARRVDELAAVSAHPRGARAGVRRFQQSQRLQRRRHAHGLRRLRERQGRRSRRPDVAELRERQPTSRAGATSCSGRRIT